MTEAILITGAVVYMAACVFGWALCRAAGKKAPTPPDDDSGCDHHWLFVGYSSDGISFYRCTRCGLQSEI